MIEHLPGRAHRRAREAERQQLWLPLGPPPRALRQVVRRADVPLAAYVLDRDDGALADLVAAQDEIASAAQPLTASPDLLAGALHRAAIVHLWTAATGGGESELSTAVRLVDDGLAVARSGSGQAARLLTLMAYVHTHRWQLSQDLDDLERAVAAAQQAVACPGDDAGRCLASTALAWVMRLAHRSRGGALDEAVGHARWAVEHSPDVPLLVLFRYRLGQLLLARYETSSALADLEEAEEHYRACLGAAVLPRQVGREALEDELGTVLRRRFLRTRLPSHIDEAVRLLLGGPGQGDDDLVRRVEHVTETFDPAHLTNIGSALLTRYDALGAPADLEAAVIAQRAAVRRTPAGDWQLASRYNNAGNAVSRAGEDQQDVVLVREAIGMYRRSLVLTGLDAPERASRCYNLATTLERLALGTPDEDAVEQTRSAYRDAVVHGATGSLEWGLAAARRWGSWAARRGAWSEAGDAYLSALDLSQRLFRVQLLREQKEVWLVESQELPGEAAYALTQAGRTDAAVEALERGRGLLLSEALDRDRTDLAQLAAAGRADLVAGYRTAAEALAAGLSRRTGAQELRELRAQLDAQAHAIREVPGHERFLVQPTVEELRRAVPPRTALVHVAVAQAGGVALVVSGTQVRHVQLPGCTVDAVRRRVEALVSQRSSGDPTSGAFEGTVDAVTGWAWRAVVGPVLEACSEPELVLVPSGLLAMLPLHAAWRPDPTRFPVGRRYALDERVVRYAPSARALEVAQRTAAGASLERCLIVSDPQPTSLPSIGLAKAEAAWVTGLLPSTTVLSGPRAGPEAVLAAAAGADVLHLSCHGASRPDDPLESGLTLAGDARLTLRALLGARLHGSGQPQAGARLVLMSACDTDQPGLALPDEVVSLPTGLLQAGAAGVVATQWAVRSVSVTLLVSRFCREWSDGASPPEALARAQRWLRDTTNGEKVRDLTAASAAPSPAAAGADDTALQQDRRALVRVLRLRDPSAREHASPVHWAALCYHGA